MDLNPLSPEEQANFKALINEAISKRSDTPPENPIEFSVYADMHYNLYMFMKGEWVNVGLNVTPLTDALP